MKDPRCLPGSGRSTLSRRSFLRGTGAAMIGLPLLELTHGKAFAQGLPAEKRFIVVFSHGGEIMSRDRSGFRATGTHHRIDDWRPVTPQETLTPGMLGATHRGLFDEHLSSMLLLRGITNMSCQKTAPHNGGHGYANITALTAAQIDSFSDSSSALALGPSIDTVVAQRLGAPAPLRVQVSGHNYGSPFFQARSQKAGASNNVGATFDALFADVLAGPPDPAVVRQRRLRRSILDGAVAGVTRFKQRVSSGDRDIIDAHLEGLRALELRVEAFEEATCAPPDASSADGINARDQQDLAGPLMADIIVAAIACGRHRVAALEIGDLITHWLGDPFGAAFGIGHSLHHAARDVGPGGADEDRFGIWRQEMLDNRRWRLGLMARIMDGLAAIPEGAGTALDNSLILYTSEFSSGSFHSSVDMPVLLAGRAGGALRTGRHLDFNTAGDGYRSPASNHNLFTSVLQAFDQGDTHFGSEHADVEGPLPGLT